MAIRSRDPEIKVIRLLVGVADESNVRSHPCEGPLRGTTGIIVQPRPRNDRCKEKWPPVFAAQAAVARTVFRRATTGLRFSADGEVRKTRWKARRIRSVSSKPQNRATSLTDRPPLSSAARAASTRSRSTTFAGVTPVSARNARAKWRGLMQARAASASTPSCCERFARMNSNSGANRPCAAPSSRRAENCDCPPGRR